MKRLLDCVVIGGGQAGLAMSQVLTARGIDHVVIERGRIGERWLSQRWPSLRLLTPNWMTRLPGPAPKVRDPEGFMTAWQFASELEAYGQRICAPVIAQTTVLSLSACDGRYMIETTSGSFLAKSVVIATGACDKPAVPTWAAAISPDICQLTSDHYRGPHALATGGVLVVGASATGTQIARELCRWGRDVVLSVGRHVRAPRRYRAMTCSSGWTRAASCRSVFPQIRIWRVSGHSHPSSSRAIASTESLTSAVWQRRVSGSWGVRCPLPLQRSGWIMT